MISSHSPRTETPEAILSSCKAGNTSYMQNAYLADLQPIWLNAPEVDVLHVSMYCLCTSLAGALPFATCTKELEPQIDNPAIFHVVHPPNVVA